MCFVKKSKKIEVIRKQKSNNIVWRHLSIPFTSFDHECFLVKTEVISMAEASKRIKNNFHFQRLCGRSCLKATVGWRVAMRLVEVGKYHNVNSVSVRTIFNAAPFSISR